MKENEHKTYLGDGAYAEFTGFDVIITAENGVEATDTVALELEAVAKLVEFIRTYKPNFLK